MDIAITRDIPQSITVVPQRLAARSGLAMIALPPSEVTRDAIHLLRNRSRSALAAQELHRGIGDAGRQPLQGGDRHRAEGSQGRPSGIPRGSLEPARVVAVKLHRTHH